MKYRNNAQFFKSLILWVAGLAFAGVMFAQLSIPTNIQNAVITISKIVLTQSGQDASASNPAIITLDAKRSNGSAVTINGKVDVSGNMNVEGNVVAGTATGDNRNIITGSQGVSVGGYYNHVNGDQSSILGGYRNTLVGILSSIVGGHNNTLNGNTSSIFGSYGSALTGESSVIIGGSNNKVNGNYATAGGQNAQALHDYTWVWSDQMDGIYGNDFNTPFISGEFKSTHSNQFLVRAYSGVGINTNNPQGSLDVQGNAGQTGLTVAYDGKVGIGTKTPTNALSVAGNANVNGYLGVGTTSPSKSLDVEQFLNEGILINRQSTTIGDYAGILLGVTAAPGNYAKGGIFLRRTASNGIGDLIFANNSVADSSNVTPTNAAMTIVSSGSVGIGTSSPSNKLSVVGNTNFSGNVGIGISNPNKPLVIKTPAYNDTSLRFIMPGVDGIYTNIEFGTDDGWTQAYMRYLIGTGPNEIRFGFGDSYNSSFANDLFRIRSNNSIVIGQYSETDGDYSTAIGYRNNAKGLGSIAMGSGSVASGINSTTMGYNTIALGTYSTAMGYKTVAKGNYSTTMGYQTTGAGLYTTAMGYNTQANGDYSTTMGASNTANGIYSTAMGASNTVAGVASFVVGAGNNVNGGNGVGIGIGQNMIVNVAGLNGAIGIGQYVEVYGDRAIAMGYYARAGGYAAIALGDGTSASGYAATSMGYNTIALGTYSTAMGRVTNANGFSSTAMGTQTQANGSVSTAMGISSIASGDYSTAMGSSITLGTYSTAMGYKTVAKGNYSTAMGYATTGAGLYSTAMGNTTQANGESSTAMGSNNVANGWGNTAMGLYNSVTGVASFVVGAGNQVNGGTEPGIAIGQNNVVTGIGGKTFGSYAEASGYDSIGIGYYGLAYGNYSVALATYNYYTSTVAKGQGALAMGYGTKANGNYSTTMGYNSTANGIYSTAMGSNNVANGQSSTAMGSNNSATGWGSVAMGLYNSVSSSSSFVVGAGNSVNGGNGVGIGIGQNMIVSTPNLNGAIGIGQYVEVYGDRAIAMGYYAKALGFASIALGSSIASGNTSTAMGAGVAIGAYSTAMGYTTQAKGNYSTAMGYKTVAVGTTSTAIGNLTTANGANSTAMGSLTTANGANSTAMGYWSVANGANSTAMGGSSYAIGSNSTAMGYWSVANGANSTAMGGSSYAIGDNSTAMGGWATANGSNSTAMGYWTVANGSNSTAMGSYNKGLSNSIFEIGIGSINVGTGLPDKKNALTVLDNGALYVDSDIVGNAQQYCRYSVETIPSFDYFSTNIGGPRTMGSFELTNVSENSYNDSYSYLDTISDINGNAVRNFWDWWNGSYNNPNIAYQLYSNGSYDDSNACDSSLDGYRWDGPNSGYPDIFTNMYQVSSVSNGNGCTYSMNTEWVYIPYTTQNFIALGADFSDNVSYYNNYYYNDMYALSMNYDGLPVDYLGNNSMASDIINGQNLTRLGSCDFTNKYFTDSYYSAYGWYNGWGWEVYSQGSVYKITGTPTTITTTTRAPSFSISQYGDVGIGTDTSANTGSSPYKLSISGDMIANTYYMYSDRKLKKNIVSLNGVGASDTALSKIIRLTGYAFDWNADSSHDVGLIADEIESVYPQLVKQDPKTGLKAVAYANLVAPLIESVKTLNSRVTDLETKLNTLTTLITSAANCGTSAGKIYASQPTTNLCNSGKSASSIKAVGTGWIWACGGGDGSVDAVCEASKTTDGHCNLDVSGQNLISDQITQKEGSDSSFCDAGTIVGGYRQGFKEYSTGWAWSCASPDVGGPATGATVSCTANRSIDATCGVASGHVYAPSAISTGVLCNPTNSVLDMYSLNNSTDTQWNWTCKGTNGGADTSCSAQKPTDAVCGSSNWSSYYDIPLSVNKPFGSIWSRYEFNSLGYSYELVKSANGVTYSFCAVGNPQSLQKYDTGWTWTCVTPDQAYPFYAPISLSNTASKNTGPSTGSNVSCKAFKKLDATCGDATNHTYSATPTTGLCNVGSPYTVDFTGYAGTQWYTWSCKGIEGGSDRSCAAERTQSCTSDNSCVGGFACSGYVATSSVIKITQLPNTTDLCPDGQNGGSNSYFANFGENEYYDGLEVLYSDYQAAYPLANLAGGDVSDRAWGPQYPQITWKALLPDHTPYSWLGGRHHLSGDIIGKMVGTCDDNRRQDSAPIRMPVFCKVSGGTPFQYGTVPVSFTCQDVNSTATPGTCVDPSSFACTTNTQCGMFSGRACVGYVPGNVYESMHWTPYVGLASADKVTSVPFAMGSDFTCAVDQDNPAGGTFGQVGCWGNNTNGQLGNGSVGGSSSTRLYVQKSSGVPLTGIVSVAISPNISHPVACALSSSGSVYCWGDNYYGQISGTLSSKVSSGVLVYSNTGAVQITVGSNNKMNCALINNGTVECWLSSFNHFNPNISNAIQISAMNAHACAVINDGTVKCWGANESHQLGNHLASISGSNSAVTVDGISDAVEVTAGWDHSCAVLKSGKVTCWGANYFGQLGDGSNSLRINPVTVDGISEALHVSAGLGYTCAVLSDKTVKCWGINNVSWDETEQGYYISTNNGVSVDGIYHQQNMQLLGGGTALGYSPIPVQIPSLTNIDRVITSTDHTCAVSTDGTTKCWGYNDDGVFGNGTATSSYIATGSANGMTIPSILYPIFGSYPAAHSGSCQITDHNVYGACSVSCGGGTQKNAYGETRACNTQACVDTNPIGIYSTAVEYSDSILSMQVDYDGSVADISAAFPADYIFPDYAVHRVNHYLGCNWAGCSWRYTVTYFGVLVKADTIRNGDPCVVGPIDQSDSLNPKIKVGVYNTSTKSCNISNIVTKHAPFEDMETVKLIWGNTSYGTGSIPAW